MQVFVEPPPPSDQDTDAGVSVKAKDEAFTVDFEPDNLKVDSRGYLYHPSPGLAREVERDTTHRRETDNKSSQRRRSTGETELKYGPYSLMRSSLILETIAPTLEMVDLEDAGLTTVACKDSRVGATFVWQKHTYTIKQLDQDHDVWRSTTWSANPELNLMSRKK
ncbi:hypothetical protein OIV83_000607 [Microbotryomycetes sp. JL201]|nr:hypothetical protein OIV83_000607 [Microbotryomycetes sp. JL201]